MASLAWKVGLEVLAWRFSPSQGAKRSFCYGTGDTVLAGPQGPGHCQLRTAQRMQRSMCQLLSPSCVQQRL